MEAEEYNDVDKQMRAVADSRKAESSLRNQKYNESSKKQLMKILETKIRTSFIAPLSYFEANFGFLWGHGKEESKLTKEELHYRQIWNFIRTNVLNNGNNQIRAVCNELNQYTVSWNRYQLNFKSDSNSEILIRETGK
jgi:hypothetical protein